MLTREFSIRQTLTVHYFSHFCQVCHWNLFWQLHDLGELRENILQQVISATFNVITVGASWRADVLHFCRSPSQTHSLNMTSYRWVDPGVFEEWNHQTVQDTSTNTQSICYNGTFLIVLALYYSTVDYKWSTKPVSLPHFTFTGF